MLVGTEAKIKQCMLEKRYNKNQLWLRLQDEFAKNNEIINIIQRNELPLDFSLALLAYMSQYKRCNLQTLVGLLRYFYDNGQATADMILKCVNADLLDWDTGKECFILRYSISQDVQDEINLYQFPLPLIVRPEKIRKNSDTGYLMSHGSCLLKNNYHEEDICLDHLNRMNSIAFRINKDVIENCVNSWKNMDHQKQGESWEQYQMRKKAFDKFNKDSRRVIDELLRIGNPIFFSHAFDKRGRCYCRGYHLSYQGNDYQKACIELYKKEKVKYGII